MLDKDLQSIGIDLTPDTPPHGKLPYGGSCADPVRGDGAVAGNI